MKLFIFDLGGVCIFNFQTIGKIAHHYHIDETFLHDNFFAIEEKIMEGTLTEKAWWLSVTETLRGKMSLDENANPLIDLFTPRKNDVVLDLILQMKQNGAHVVCGSNTCENHWKLMNACGNLENVFDTCYLSQRMHIAKPKKEFFEYILAKENVRACDAFFVDDMKANVESANAVGLQTLLFQDTPSWSAYDKLKSLVLTK